MNFNSIKIELIDWIAGLDDQQAVHKILTLKKKLSSEEKQSASKIFGSGDHLVESISDDFNEPLDVFKGRSI